MGTNRRLRWSLACAGLVFVHIVFALPAPVPAQTSSSKTVRHHQVPVEDQSQSPELTQAEVAIEKKDYAGAESLLKKVVDSQPKNYQAWFDLGFVYNALGRTDDSINSYRQSVSAKPDVFESNLNLGLMLARNKQAGADEFLRAATKLKPTSHVDQGHASAWLALARSVQGTNPDEAIDAYQKAAALQPKDPEPHLSAGQLYETQNKLTEAEQEYKQALVLDPNSADAVVGLANVYMQGKRLPEAEDYLRKTAAQRPNDAVVHVQLGRVLAAQQKYDDAIPPLQMALKLAPNDVGARRDLADVYVNAGKYTEADSLYRSLLAAQPNDPELHHQYGEALMKLKKFGEAEQQFLAAVKLKPDWGAAYGDLAVAANENQDYPLAIKALDMRAKYLPEIPVGYFLRATAYDHLRDFHQAAANYHLFLQVANGKYPDQEWQARHRLITIEPKK
jgi:tetratricopeptide (TPR) repeat protein